MPSIHINDDVFGEYVLKHGGSQEAKTAIKELVEENIE